MCVFCIQAEYSLYSGCIQNVFRLNTVCIRPEYKLYTAGIPVVYSFDTLAEILLHHHLPVAYHIDAGRQQTLAALAAEFKSMPHVKSADGIDLVGTGEDDGIDAGGYCTVDADGQCVGHVGCAHHEVGTEAA